MWHNVEFDMGELKLKAMERMKEKEEFDKSLHGAVEPNLDLSQFYVNLSQNEDMFQMLKSKGLNNLTDKEIRRYLQKRTL